MKRILIALMTVFFTVNVVAEESNPSVSQSSVEQQESKTMLPSTKADVNYKLYPTQNMYIFLLLDTRNGQIWQVQWHTEFDKRLTSVLSLDKMASGENEIPGRFELYPTTNMYNFIMVDQINGCTWQVQWNVDRDKRFVSFIF